MRPNLATSGVLSKIDNRVFEWQFSSENCSSFTQLDNSVVSKVVIVVHGRVDLVLV